jgi:hypothetical protein
MRRELQWKRRGLHRLFFVLVLLPMLCVFPYIRAVNNPNEFVRVYTVMALVENHTFRIDEQVQTWGWVNDMARIKGKDDGTDHYFMVKAPTAVYLGLPGYFLFSKVVAPILGKKYPAAGVKPGADPHVIAKAVVSTQDERLWWLKMATWSMRLFASQIPCFLFLLWFERYLRAFSPDPGIRYAAVAACGLGTNYLAYTHMFASHSQYAAIAFLAFATIETELRRSHGDILRMRPSRALLAGFFTSACVTLEYHALFMTVVMSLFAVFTFWSPLRAVFWVIGLVPPLRGARRWIPLGASVNPTRVLAYAIGGLLNVPHMMYFHWTAYGNAFTPGHQQLETSRFAAEHQMGLWGILWPTWDHIRALMIDPGFGFFGMSPFMWLGLIGVPLLVVAPRGAPEHRRQLRIASIVWLACMTMVFGVNAGFVEWRAGWTVGPRYLVVCAPFFAFGGCCTLERLAHGSRSKRAVARGLGGGLALAGVVTIGTVGLIYDTLPETIARPFAQFSIPMARAGLVPHHIGEWFGWQSTTLWYIVCAAMLLAPAVAGLWPSPGDRPGPVVARSVSFVVAFVVGMVPAFTPTDDSSALFVLHPSTAVLAVGWEPPGRDRVTHLREEAERYGTRGAGPCIWYRVADLERSLYRDGQASRDESRARGVARERCPRTYF